jgi:hypothetical protein
MPDTHNREVARGEGAAAIDRALADLRKIRDSANTADRQLSEILTALNNGYFTAAPRSIRPNM